MAKGKRIFLIAFNSSMSSFFFFLLFRRYALSYYTYLYVRLHSQLLPFYLSFFFSFSPISPFLALVRGKCCVPQAIKTLVPFLTQHHCNILSPKMEYGVKYTLYVLATNEMQQNFHWIMCGWTRPNLASRRTVKYSRNITRDSRGRMRMPRHFWSSIAPAESANFEYWLEFHRSITLRFEEPKSWHSEPIEYSIPRLPSSIKWFLALRATSRSNRLTDYYRLGMQFPTIDDIATSFPKIRVDWSTSNKLHRNVYTNSIFGFTIESITGPMKARL